MVTIIILSSILFFTINGMVFERNMLLKFFICYETFLFTLSVIIIISSIDINEMLIILLLLWNSTFEAVLALSVSYRYNALVSGYQYFMVNIDYWILNHKLITIDNYKPLVTIDI